MGTSPTSKSASNSNAAKDDALGVDANGHVTFTIAQLLANDAGGANKLGVGQFFFGSGHDNDSPLAQQLYMTTHGIIDNHDGTYTAALGDFDYSVQIGNKGTWSTAHVDVAPHAGGNLFTENFDGYTNAPQFDVVDLHTKNDWSGASHSELGASGYGNIAATSGGASGFWLDTRNSPGPVDMSHTFIDPTGGKAQLSFDVATQSLDYQGQHYATDPNGSFAFKVDGKVVAEYTTAQLNAAGGENHMLHFDVQFDTGAAGSQHTLELVDLSAPGFTGFAVDSIHVNDWIV
jgi:hypothetical protein